MSVVRLISEEYKPSQEFSTAPASACRVKPVHLRHRTIVQGWENSVRDKNAGAILFLFIYYLGVFLFKVWMGTGGLGIKGTHASRVTC